MTTIGRPRVNSAVLIAAQRVVMRRASRAVAATAAAQHPDILAWAAEHYFIPETGQPIQLAPFQKAVLRYALQRTTDGFLRWRTVIWSQVKKSGKRLAAGW